MKKYIKIKNTAGAENKLDFKWVSLITVWTFALAAFFAFAAAAAASGLTLFASCAVLLCLILVGVAFDMIGVAAMSAGEAPFHSMAARNVRGARRAIWLIRNRDKVSNFCNDVIGDILGIVSGTAAAGIVAFILSQWAAGGALPGILVTGATAALTVGGKAAGKSFAVSRGNDIVYAAALIIGVFKPDKKLRKRRSRYV